MPIGSQVRRSNGASSFRGLQWSLSSLGRRRAAAASGTSRPRVRNIVRSARRRSAAGGPVTRSIFARRGRGAWVFEYGFW